MKHVDLATGNPVAAANWRKHWLDRPLKHSDQWCVTAREMISWPMEHEFWLCQPPNSHKELKSIHVSLLLKLVLGDIICSYQMSDACCRRPVE
jgi:hypothetical protein